MLIETFICLINGLIINQLGKHLNRIHSKVELGVKFVGTVSAYSNFN